MNSVFQNIGKERILYEGKYFRITKNAYPVSPNHLLVVSNERKDDFSLSLGEQVELLQIITKAKEIIEKTPQPDGYNSRYGFWNSSRADSILFSLSCNS